MTNLVICNQSTIDSASKRMASGDGEAILYTLQDGFLETRADYKSLLSLVKKLDGPVTCEIFLHSEFNPTFKLLDKHAQKTNKCELTYPETMPTNAKFGGVPFEYARRILPYPGKKIDPEIATKTLIELSSILNRAEIYWHACFGTLLGIHRDHDLFPWDTDLDIITDESNLQKVANLFPELINQGYEIARINNNMITFWKNNTGIDLYILRQNNAEHCFYIGRKKYTKDLTLPSVDCSKIQKFKNVKVPCNAGEILENLYGKNWHKPDPNWEWKPGQLF